jgi:hypothetical protein
MRLDTEIQGHVISGCLTVHCMVLEGSHSSICIYSGEGEEKQTEKKENKEGRINQSSYGIRSLVGYIRVIDTVSSCPFPFEHIPQQYEKRYLNRSPCDACSVKGAFGPRHLGCQVLRQALWKMEQRPLLHVFGHIHGGYGKEVVYWDPYQRAYEAIMGGESRWWKLCVLFYSWILRLFSLRLFFDRTAASRATALVNAATIGGVRDEKRREAICVDFQGRNNRFLSGCT